MTTDASISIDLLVPILRALRNAGPQVEAAAFERGRQILSAVGFKVRDLADPELRIPHSVGVGFLEEAIRISGDPLFALHTTRILTATSHYSIFTSPLEKSDLPASLEGLWLVNIPRQRPGALVHEPPKAACVLWVPLYRAVGHLKVAGLGYSKRSCSRRWSSIC